MLTVTRTDKKEVNKVVLDLSKQQSSTRNNSKQQVKGKVGQAATDMLMGKK